MARHSRARTIRELVAVNESLAIKLGEFVADAETREAELVAELEQTKNVFEAQQAAWAEAVKEKDSWYGRWRRDQDLVTEANKRATSSDLDRREAEGRAKAAEGERDKAVAGRNEARVYADMMRRQAFPDRPRFPWERPGMSDNRY